MGAVTSPPPSTARFGRIMRAMPDARLASRVRAGDERAFEAIFDRYHRQLLAFCRHMLGTREEAEDALQHVFVSAHRSLVAADGAKVADLRPWLYAIARNRCLSVLRARREAVALDDVPEPTAEGLAVAAEFEQREDLRDVLGDLARLPDDQRAALVLSELGALSHDEVADVLGVRKDKVKALVFQARESLAGWRTARDADCGEIREQLATLTGGALRRAPLRRHLDTCEGCRTFRGEVRRQREAMALLLPVVPTIALKAKVIGAVAASVHGGPAAGAGLAGASAAASGGGTAAGAGGGLAALGGGFAGKALVVAAIAGTAGGGYAVVKDQTSNSGVEPVVRQIKPVIGSATPVAAPATARPKPAAATPAKPVTARVTAAKSTPKVHKARPVAVAPARPAPAGAHKAPRAETTPAAAVTTPTASAPTQSSAPNASSPAPAADPPKKPKKPKPAKPEKTTPPVVTAPEESAGGGDDGADPATSGEKLKPSNEDKQDKQDKHD